MVMPNRVSQEAAAAGPETEEGRRPTIVPGPAAASPELSDRPRRRVFSVQDKLRILADVDKAVASGVIGAVGAILRREGTYSSVISDWRRQRAAGSYAGLAPVKRGPKVEPVNPLAAELAAARRDVTRLQRRLDRAESIIDLQKKVAELLGIPPLPTDGEL